MSLELMIAFISSAICAKILLLIEIIIEGNQYNFTFGSAALLRLFPIKSVIIFSSTNNNKQQPERRVGLTNSCI